MQGVYLRLKGMRSLHKHNISCPGACLKNHSCHLHTPFCVIFVPNSGYIARYAPFIWNKSPTKCDAHLTKSIFKTRSNTTANFLKLQSYGVINMHSGSCVYDNTQLLLYLQLYFVQFHVLILLPSALSMGSIFF